MSIVCETDGCSSDETFEYMNQDTGQIERYCENCAIKGLYGIRRGLVSLEQLKVVRTVKTSTIPLSKAEYTVQEIMRIHPMGQSLVRGIEAEWEERYKKQHKRRYNDAVKLLPKWLKKRKI